MGDAVALTNYLRDYIWSIGMTQMRAARRDGSVTPRRCRSRLRLQFRR